MPTRKSPFSLIPVLICFVAVLWLAVACADAAPEYRNFDKEPYPTRSPAMGGSVPTSTESPDDREERMTKVRLKYTPLFKRQPNVHGWGVVSLRDENGNRTETRGIEIRVTEKVGQSTLPPEDRIPDCLEGVPVQFREEPLARLLSKPLEDHLGPEESNRRD